MIICLFVLNGVKLICYGHRFSQLWFIDACLGWLDLFILLDFYQLYLKDGVTDISICINSSRSNQRRLHIGKDLLYNFTLKESEQNITPETLYSSSWRKLVGWGGDGMRKWEASWRENGKLQSGREGGCESRGILLQSWNLNYVYLYK